MAAGAPVSDPARSDSLSTRGTNGERAGERGSQDQISSPQPSPPSDGGEGASAPMVEKKAYRHIGPTFGTMSKQAVTEAIKACRDKRDGDWLLILGFACESGITELSRSFGNFQVSIVCMHDDA